MELDANQIQEILPHRPPFLLVDRITGGEPGVWAQGIKCVTVNEPFFAGHFPGYHVMPGVLIMEALAQVGAVAILSLPENKGKLAFFGGIKNARFKRQVVPGDVLELECVLTKQKGPVGIGEGNCAFFHAVHFNQSILTQRIQVVVYGRCGLQSDGGADLAHGGRIAVLCCEFCEETKNFIAFAACPAHVGSSFPACEFSIAHLSEKSKHLFKIYKPSRSKSGM